MVVAGGLVSANYRGLSISIEGREGGCGVDYIIEDYILTLKIVPEEIEIFYPNV